MSKRFCEDDFDVDWDFMDDDQRSEYLYDIGIDDRIDVGSMDISDIQERFYHMDGSVDDNEDEYIENDEEDEETMDESEWLDEINAISLRECVQIMLDEAGIAMYYSYPLWKKMKEYLINENCLTIKNENGRNVLMETDEGRKKGIVGVWMDFGNGDRWVVLYPEDSQARTMIKEKFTEFIGEIDNDSPGGRYYPKTREGMFCGRMIRFNSVFSDHVFSDEEVDKLLDGDIITISCKTKYSPNVSVRCRIQQRENSRGKFFGIVSEWMKEEFKEEYGYNDVESF